MLTSGKSMPTNCRITAESYNASSTAGSDRLNHAAKNKSAASAPLPPAGAHSPAWDNGVRLARTLLATAQLVPSLPEIPVVVFFCVPLKTIHGGQTLLLFVRRSHLPQLTLYSCGNGELIQSRLSVCSMATPRLRPSNRSGSFPVTRWIAGSPSSDAPWATRSGWQFANSAILALGSKRG